MAEKQCCLHLVLAQGVGVEQWTVLCSGFCKAKAAAAKVSRMRKNFSRGVAEFTINNFMNNSFTNNRSKQRESCTGQQRDMRWSGKEGDRKRSLRCAGEQGVGFKVQR